MRRHIHIAALLLMAGASQAGAETNEDRIVRDLNEQGFRDIEISREDGLMKVEAWRGAHQLEITYDLSTGDILEREMELHPGAPGLALGRPDDDEDDDRGRGRGRGGDDGRAGDDDDDHDSDDNGRGDSDDGPGDNDGDDDGDDRGDDHGGDRDGDDSDDGPGDDNGGGRGGSGRGSDG